jgi:hypothetical protein
VYAGRLKLIQRFMYLGTQHAQPFCRERFTSRKSQVLRTAVLAGQSIPRPVEDSGPWGLDFFN